MSKGIYTAVSGAMAQDARLDTIANNLANVNTAGFKKDRQVFNEYLTAYEKQPEVIEVPRIPASVESFYDMQGGDKSYVDSNGTYTSFSQGPLKTTGSPLDFCLEGKGFFEVLTPQGVRYTRSGGFQVDANGRLVTKNGDPVLRQGNQDPAQRMIQVKGRKLTVSASGDIYEGGARVGRFSLLNFLKPDDLQKVGGTYFQMKADATTTPVVAENIKVHQGALEGSNINVVDEMTNMITAERTFQATQQAIKAFDHMDDKLINGVGR